MVAETLLMTDFSQKFALEHAFTEVDTAVMLFRGRLSPAWRTMSLAERMAQYGTILDEDPACSARAVVALSASITGEAQLQTSLLPLLRSIVIDPDIRTESHLSPWFGNEVTVFYGSFPADQVPSEK